MRKTENYRLSQWDLDDRILMDDFNSDHLKIDAALASLASNSGGFKVLKDIIEPGPAQCSAAWSLIDLLGSWADWAVVGVLFEISSFSAFDSASDSFSIQFSNSSASSPAASVFIPRPITSLTLFPVMRQDNHPLSGLVLAENFIKPFHASSNFADISKITFDFHSNFDPNNPHTFSYSRILTFAVK